MSSELVRPRRWPGTKIDANAGQRRARAGRRVGRQAQMTPVLHSMADHIKTARLSSKTRIYISFCGRVSGATDSQERS
jgi:hypothetical protein